MHEPTVNPDPKPTPNNGCAGAVPTGHAETVILRPPCDRLAAIAYKAYGDSTGGKNYQGLPMPEWDQLPAAIHQAWREAVRAVVHEAERGVRDALLSGRL